MQLKWETREKNERKCCKSYWDKKTMMERKNRWLLQKSERFWEKWGWRKILKLIVHTLYNCMCTRTDESRIYDEEKLCSSNMINDNDDYDEFLCLLRIQIKICVLLSKDKNQNRVCLHYFPLSSFTQFYNSHFPLPSFSHVQLKKNFFSNLLHWFLINFSNWKTHQLLFSRKLKKN